ncbi:MAG: hypothetical protein HYU66_00165 [Armatimonadetes bacterium]|nr:hypothetical protein [Armatimonadota bacterium]
MQRSYWIAALGLLGAVLVCTKDLALAVSVPGAPPAVRVSRSMEVARTFAARPVSPECAERRAVAGCADCPTKGQCKDCAAKRAAAGCADCPTPGQCRDCAAKRAAAGCTDCPTPGQCKSCAKAAKTAGAGCGGQCADRPSAG